MSVNVNTCTGNQTAACTAVISNSTANCSKKLKEQKGKRPHPKGADSHRIVTLTLDRVKVISMHNTYRTSVVTVSETDTKT